MNTQRFMVTFWNEMAGRRGVVLDDLSADEAEAVRAKFSDKRDRFTYLPEVRVEADAKESA